MVVVVVMHGAPVVSSVYGKVDAVVSAGYTGQGGDSCCDVYFHCCITHHAFPHARTHMHAHTHTHTHTHTQRRAMQSTMSSLGSTTQLVD